MAIYGGNTRKCATCANWTGPRRVTNLGSTVETDGNAEGVCGHYRRIGTLSYEHVLCQFWEKWPVLR